MKKTTLATAAIAMLAMLASSGAAAADHAGAPADKAAVEQEQGAGGNDPTVLSAKMADAIRSQIADYQSIQISALVVGADNNGVAIVTARSDAGAGENRPGRAADSRVHVARKGMTIPVTMNGMPVKVTVKGVTADGVELETSAKENKVLIPGVYRSLKTEGDAELSDDCLRYVECTDMPISLLMSLIADQSGINISISESAAAAEVSIFLRNVPSDVAVEEICRARGLWFRHDEKNGILRVSTMEEYQDNLTTFREEETETFTLLYPNVVEIASVIYGLYPDRVYMTLGEQEIIDDQKNDLARRFERFSVIDSASSSSLLSLKPGDISAASGSGSTFNSADDGRRDRIRSAEDRAERFGGISADVARAIEQGNAGGGDPARARRLLELYRNRAPSIFVTISRRNNIIIVRTSDPQVMREIRDLIRRLDVATPSVLLEMRIMQIALDDGFSSSFEYEFNTTTKSEGNEYRTTAGFPGFGPLSASARTDTMSFQLLSEHFNARIQLLATEGKVKTIATPTLLIANNEVSSVFIGEEIPITTDVTLEPVIGTSASGGTYTTGYTVNPTVEVTPIGTMLVITPNINADRSVTLHLLQEESSRVVDGGSIPYGDAAALQSFKVDTIASRKISGTFITQDGLIAAIGGLIRETDAERISRVPFLGRIPLIGFLFRSKEIVKERSELVILVRPHVITTPAESEAKSREILERIAPRSTAAGLEGKVDPKTLNSPWGRRATPPLSNEPALVPDAPSAVAPYTPKPAPAN